MQGRVLNRFIQCSQDLEPRASSEMVEPSTPASPFKSLEAMCFKPSPRSPWLHAAWTITALYGAGVSSGWGEFRRV